MKRTRSMVLRFTQAELDTLTKKAKKAGRSRESFCRDALNGVVIQAAPPTDFFTLIRELRRIGSNIDQLLKIARTKGFIDAPALRKALSDLDAWETMLRGTFMPGC